MPRISCLLTSPQAISTNSQGEEPLIFEHPPLNSSLISIALYIWEMLWSYFASSSLKSLGLTWLPILQTRTPGSECCTSFLYQSQTTTHFCLAVPSQPNWPQVWLKIKTFLLTFFKSPKWEGRGIRVSCNTKRCSCQTDWMKVEVFYKSIISLKIKRDKVRVSVHPNPSNTWFCGKPGGLYAFPTRI